MDDRPKPLAVCLQVDDETFAVLEAHVREVVDLQRFSYFDKARLEELDGVIAMFFCGWDGVGKSAQPFLARLPKRSDTTRRLAIGILPKGATIEAIPVAVRKQATWFSLPREAARLHSLVFDTFASGAKSESVATAAEPKSEKAEAIRDPALCREIEVVEKVRLHAFPPPVKNSATAAQPGPRRKESILVFTEEAQVAHTLMRRLRECGFSHIDVAPKVGDVLCRLRAERTDLLLTWHQDLQGIDKTASAVKVLYELHEARDLDFVGTLVLCPGEAAVKSFGSEAREVFIDTIAVQTYTQRELNDIFAKTFAALENPALPRRRLHELRKPWRPGAADFDRQALSQEAIRAGGKNIFDVKHKSVWARTDAVLHLLLAGQTPEALASATSLAAEFPHNFDVAVTLATVRAMKGVAKEVASELVESILTRYGLTEDRCFRLGRMFIRWRAFDALRALLGAWSTREELEVNAQFAFLAAEWRRQEGDPDGALAYLRQAVNDAPGRADFLEEFATALEAKRRFEPALTVWRAASIAHRANRANCGLGVARCLIERRDFAAAATVLAHLRSSKLGDAKILATLESKIPKAV